MFRAVRIECAIRVDRRGPDDQTVLGKTMTPTRGRVLYAILTTVAAAVVYIIIARVLGDSVGFEAGHGIALAIIFVLSYLWAPRLHRTNR